MSVPKRYPTKAARNERRKAVATTLNAVSVSIFVAALIQPLTTGRLVPLPAGVAIVTSLVLQATLHYVLTRLED